MGEMERPENFEVHGTATVGTIGRIAPNVEFMGSVYHLGNVTRPFVERAPVVTKVTSGQVKSVAVVDKPYGDRHSPLPHKDVYTHTNTKTYASASRTVVTQPYGVRKSGKEFSIECMAIDVFVTFTSDFLSRSSSRKC